MCPAPPTPRRRSVVITHLFNEEYLLPFWLEHHGALFDHGVIIDHGSTDASKAIVARMCPTWEIRDSRLSSFGARETDQEVMEAEREFPGWIKAVLTVTEFLMCTQPLADLFLPGSDPACVHMKPLAASGDLADPATLPDLLRGITRVCTTARPGSRFLHTHPDGRYYVGRHLTEHDSAPVDPERGPFLLWLGFYPWNDRFRRRKAQIGARIPQSDFEQGFSWQHAWDHARVLLQKERVDEASVPVQSVHNGVLARLLAGEA